MQGADVVSGDTENSGCQWDIGTAQLIRRALAIEALKLKLYGGCSLNQVGGRCHRFNSKARMCDIDAALLFGQFVPVCSAQTRIHTEKTQVA